MHWSRDGEVDIATSWTTEGSGSSTGRVKNILFSTSSKQALGPTKPPVKRVPEDLSPGRKLARV
jgi:hypothetical protein